MTLDNLTSFTAGTKAKASEINSNFSLVEEAINENSTKIDTLNNNKANLVPTPTINHILTTDSTGNPVDSGKYFNDEGTSENEILSANKINENISILNSYVNTKTSYVPQQYWSKLVNSTSDLEHDILFQRGRQPDKNLSMIISLPNTTKQIDSTWTQGNNAGGLASALTLSANTTYHCFAISKNDRDLKKSLYIDFTNSLTGDEYENTVSTIGAPVLDNGKCTLNGTSGIKQTSLNSFCNGHWEIIMNVNLSSMPSNYAYVFKTDTQAVHLLVQSDGRMRIYLSSNGISQDIFNGGIIKTGITASNDYKFKVIFTGTKYQLWTSTNESAFIKDWEYSSSIPINDFNTITFGSKLTGDNGLTGSIDNLEIKMERETTDAGFDTDTNASNLLSDATGYTKYRRVGSIKTDANANIREFVQVSDQFIIPSTPTTKTGVLPTVASSLSFDELPSGVSIMAQVNYVTIEGTQGTNHGWIYSPMANDRIPSSTSYNVAQISGSAHIDNNSFSGDILTNDGSIKHIFDNDKATYGASVSGWIDLFTD